MIFPFCEQGLIIKAKVKIINKDISICDECDAVWEKEEIISSNTGTSFCVNYIQN